MDKKILNDYIDACALIKETEEDIRSLRTKRKTIETTNVKGSNPDFPHNPQHFTIAGTAFTYSDYRQLRMEEVLLKQRKENAERIKAEVEGYMNTIPARMQRIIRFKLFQGFSWNQVAYRMGKKSTGDSVRMELERFLKESED